MPKILHFRSHRQGALDITAEIAAAISASDMQDGVAHLLLQHTSASLTIQENADPDVLADLNDFLAGLAPENKPYRHSAEGPDDMPAHLRSVLTATSLSIPVADGVMMLGIWQAIYLLEHRRQPHQRSIAIAFTPE